MAAGTPNQGEQDLLIHIDIRNNRRISMPRVRVAAFLHLLFLSPLPRSPPSTKLTYVMSRCPDTKGAASPTTAS